MKQIILILFAAATVINFYACNSGESDKKAEEVNADTTKKTDIQQKIMLDVDCSGVGNMVIYEEEATKMMERYFQIYKKVGTSGEIRNLGDSVWIDGLIIRSLAAFFDDLPAGKGFDGARFINGAPTGNNKSVLFMVPTRPGNAKFKHTEVWGTVFTLLEGTPVKYMDFNRDSAYVKTRIHRFDAVYRKPGGTNIDSLSSKIWISKCIFTELRKIIENTSDPVDGIRIYFGAYNAFNPKIAGQKYQYQSTILFVPTTRDNFGNDNARWDIIKAKYIHKDDAFNHGELCPQQCE